MLKILRLLLLVGLLATAFVALQARAATANIVVLSIDGAINPVAADYIEHGIDRAEEMQANVTIIQMDTPGGLDTSMRDIIQAMDKAPMPVVVYIPSGARAASAGFFITIAADVAAMAPDTNIGSAHPVAIGTEGETGMSETMEEKVVNDAAAYARGIAQAHGRNVEWAEEAVRESANVEAATALELNVIDMVAVNLDALITQLDGREVTTVDGSVVTLHTEGATVNHIEMSLIEDFLYTISDPNIAYILLSVAMLGIIVEISSPGLIFPGVVGGICGILAFYSLGQLPVNWAGVLLIILAFGLFVAEVFTATFGLFTAGGIVSLVLGALILLPGGSPVFRISPWLIATVAILIGALFAFVISRVIRAHHRQASTGREELIGKKAVVKVALDPEGTVFFKGERWNAVSEAGRAEPGEEVIITKVDGLKLWVTKKE